MRLGVIKGVMWCWLDIEVFLFAFYKTFCIEQKGGTRTMRLGVTKGGYCVDFVFGVLCLHCYEQIIEHKEGVDAGAFR
jgi:hypothetical protein